ncbi:MAG: AMP-binding protein [Actinomycetales bacterium]|nr:AMP-binding protein [Actinomycetales bacterium]
MTRPLRLVPAPPGADREILDALAAALDGSGPPLAPVRPGGQVPDGQGPEDGAAVADGVTLAITTSGSTGSPRTVLLPRSALVASAAATDARLGGPAQWLLALPVHHVAGLQVLVRSLLAGTDPVLLDQSARFTAESFAAATARLDGPRRYTSLVPTQLHRVLASPTGTEALATYDAVLVGGAATDPALLLAAREAGAQIVRTYGMTETSGGCVYDGVPLDGVRVELDREGRIFLAGPVLATGYLGEPELTARTFVERDGVRWLRTDDAGTLSEGGTSADDGALRVLGRLDDMISTGGVKVAPAAVEAALTGLTGIAQASVVGVPDPEWGAAVVAVVVPSPGHAPPSLESVRAHVAHSLGAPAAPRRVLVIDELPERGPGKTDRRAVQRIAAETPV